MLNDLYFYLAKHPRFMYSAYQKVRIYKTIPTEKDSGVYYGIKI